MRAGGSVARWDWVITDLDAGNPTAHADIDFPPFGSGSAGLG